MAARLPSTAIHRHYSHSGQSRFRLATLSSANRIPSLALFRPTSSSSYFKCRATSTGPPPPPDPPGNDELSSPGITTSLYSFQETAKIFIAVMFWMSLFFWASVWDGRNDDRPDKRSRFRK